MLPSQLSQWVESGLGLVDFREKKPFFTIHITGSTNLIICLLTSQNIALAVLLPEEFSEEILEDFKNRSYPIEFRFISNNQFWDDPHHQTFFEHDNNKSKILWQPSPVLGGVIQTIERMRSEEGLPKEGLAIDLACGSGRDGIFLSLRGWITHNFDHSKDQLTKVLELADIYDVSDKVLTYFGQVEDPSCFHGLPQADLLNVSRFLDVNAWDLIKSLIKPGGFIVYHTFMEGCSKPRRAHFKLKEGQLADVFQPPEWTVIEDRTFHISDGRPTSWFLARKSS